MSRKKSTHRKNSTMADLTLAIHEIHDVIFTLATVGEILLIDFQEISRVTTQMSEMKKCGYDKKRYFFRALV